MQTETQPNADRRLELRLRRQALLTQEQDPPLFHFLLDEAVLHRQVGDRELITEQFDRLVEVGRQRNVALHVLPFSAGCHDGLTAGPFVIMDFPQDDVFGAESTTVYVEGFATAMYLDKPPTVARYLEAFDTLMKKALDERASRELITQIAGSLR